MPTESEQREQRIIAVVRSLGEGEVVTYGDIAEVSGCPKQSRLVGRILSQSSEVDDLPWWRVVNAAGRLVPGHETEQTALLRTEDVLVARGRVTNAPFGRFRREEVSR